MRSAQRCVRLAAALCLIAALAACSSRSPGPIGPSVPTAGSSGTSSATGASSSAAAPAVIAASPAAAAPSNGSPTAPVIVLDPGHAPTIQSTDPATGLDDSDYENEPEMQDVYAVALLVKAKLETAGYKVIMTKNSATDRVSLGQRAAVANNAHAALALSIHDQAGANGGLAFSAANNIVYYQSVGDYRATPAGAKVTFTDAAVAATSQKDGQIFQTQRSTVEGHPVKLQGDVGYDLGTRGLPAGNIWIVQLLSKVPWVYNEAGGNSAGTVGLNATDKQKYADGLVAGVEGSVPIGPK